MALWDGAIRHRDSETYVPGSKLPLFPYNKGWSSTSRGLYTHEIRIPIKGGMTIPNIATFEEVPTSESRVWVGIC